MKLLDLDLDLTYKQQTMRDYEHEIWWQQV